MPLPSESCRYTASLTRWSAAAYDCNAGLLSVPEYAFPPATLCCSRRSLIRCTEPPRPRAVQFDMSHQQPMRMPRRSPTRRSKQISLGLQGGGSFGAFTWGVLDRLLEHEGLDFDIVSGASAEAMNAVVLASGLADGGQTEARRRLDRFWRRLGTGATVPPPMMAALEMSAHLISPYQSNPLGL